MDRIKQYLGKQGLKEGRIEEKPAPNLGLIVVIPAYKEPDILRTLSSLYLCSSPDCDVEIIILVNAYVIDTPETKLANDLCIKQCLKFKSKLKGTNTKLHILEELDMPVKKGGVGLARKILMDEACYRLSVVGNSRGIISNLDADCTVSQNYLAEIVCYFSDHVKFNAASINFKHEIDHESIIKYELHLRYFIGMQRVLDLPFAFQTIGSAMAVRAESYAAVGGMNTRKAGEDFYFLHKFIKNQDCGNLNTATVFPSGRVSDRVPFGTGKAVGDMRVSGHFTTYNPESFLLLLPLISGLAAIYEGDLPELDFRLTKFLTSIHYKAKIAEIRKHTKDFKAFEKRFYQFFDAFILMKYLHFVRDFNLPDLTLSEALPVYYELIGSSFSGINEDSLEELRIHDMKF